MAVTREADRSAGINPDTLRTTIQGLVDDCAARGLIAPADRVWAYNTVLDMIGCTRPGPHDGWARRGHAMPGTDAAASSSAAEPTELPVPFDMDAALERLSRAAAAAGVVEDTASGRDRAAMRIMGALMPRPSQVAHDVHALLAAGRPREATQRFYQLCCDAGYVRRSAIARNISWNVSTRWGTLEITINLSKPEKDPRDIAAAGAARPSGEAYPACQLCIENEGYPGRGASDGGAHPARQNLRIVPITLGGERWGLQYSPYAYFNEHCIAMSAEHRPMHIDETALDCLLDFVDLLPHYFIGSNADLPVVGGSILSHDHFQGGAHEFPMMKAEVASTFSMSDFPGVSGAVLVWPLSVLRLRGRNRNEVTAAAAHVMQAWRAWSDEAAGVVAHSADDTPHNTVTPIVRRTPTTNEHDADGYEVCLALRCNITSDEHPLGVFHPHAEYHHIKRENIGLIEVMGLAILPPRLKDEMATVERILLDGAAAGHSPATVLAELEVSQNAASHAAWAADVFERRLEELSSGNAHDVIQQEVGEVFSHVLENAGVFKWDAAGRAAQQRFIDSL